MHLSNISRKPIIINNTDLQAHATVQIKTRQLIFCSNIANDRTACYRSTAVVVIGTVQFPVYIIR